MKYQQQLFFPSLSVSQVPVVPPTAILSITSSQQNRPQLLVLLQALTDALMLLASTNLAPTAARHIGHAVCHAAACADSCRTIMTS
jgi:hypothetical protein